MSAENISYDLKRFAGIKRDYTPKDVERLRGSIKIEYSMCKHQSTKLWNLLNSEPYVNTLGSLSGNHAVQHAKAGLKAIYLSGWQVAADANSAGEMYPDQSLYPYDSAPKLVVIQYRPPAIHSNKDIQDVSSNILGYTYILYLCMLSLI